MALDLDPVLGSAGKLKKHGCLAPTPDILLNWPGQEPCDAIVQTRWRTAALRPVPPAVPALLELVGASARGLLTWGLGQCLVSATGNWTSSASSQDIQMM